MDKEEYLARLTVKYNKRAGQDLGVLLRDVSIDFEKTGEVEAALSAVLVASKLKPGSPYLKKKLERLRHTTGTPATSKNNNVGLYDEDRNENFSKKSSLEKAYHEFRICSVNLWGTALEQNISFISKKEIIKKINDAYDNGKRLSVIRGGDGEGCFLYRWQKGFDSFLFEECARKTLYMHFGPQDYRNNDYLHWANELLMAFETSEVITSARSVRAMHNLISLKNISDYRGMVGQISGSIQPHLIAKKTGAHLYEDGHLHRDLSDSYKEIFKDKKIVLVGPNGEEFSSYFSEFFECQVTETVTIPGQYIVEESKTLAALYPHYYQKVSAALNDIDIKGKLFVVAAGLAGKVFCARIAQRGGIALDVGSMMDAWAGKRARKYHDEAFLKKNALA